MELEISLELLSLLVLLAGVAGLVDAIAGGGGLLIIPLLLWAGLSPAQALATNKLQAVFGSFAATVRFLRQGAISLSQMGWPIAFTFSGAALGAIAIQRFDAHFLEKLLPLLLICFALYFLFSPKLSDKNRHARISTRLFAFSAGFGIGFYDGFFGPGTGSFFALAFVSLLGFNLVKATAHAKLLNFTSNLAALCLFIAGGEVLWKIGLPMAAAQLIGGYLGAHLAIHHGISLIRPTLVIVSLAMAIKLLADVY